MNIKGFGRKQAKGTTNDSQHRPRSSIRKGGEP